jgi:hypothetical protein
MMWSWFRRMQSRYQRTVLGALIVLASVSFLAAQVIKPVNEFLTSTGVLTYLTLIAVLDIALTVSRMAMPTSRLSVGKEQDEILQDLLSAADGSRGESADLLEYAGVSTAPLIRRLREADVSMRILIKHPATCGAYQRRRTQANIESLYGSVLDGYAKFEIRCYRASFGLRGRRIGTSFLELGWLTHDFKRDTAYGRANPSVHFNPKNDGGNPLIGFFDKTFEELWGHPETVDARSTLPAR